MPEIRIAEINIVTILIVIIVGSMGIISLCNNDKYTATACVSGLLGYMGRAMQTHNNDTTTTTTNNYGDDTA